MTDINSLGDVARTTGTCNQTPRPAAQVPGVGFACAVRALRGSAPPSTLFRQPSANRREGTMASGPVMACTQRACDVVQPAGRDQVHTPTIGSPAQRPSRCALCLSRHASTNQSRNGREKNRKEREGEKESPYRNDERWGFEVRAGGGGSGVGSRKRNALIRST